MREMKATLNVRLTSDINVSFTFTALVDTTDEAEEFGSSCCDLVTAWVAGYGSTAETDA